MDKNQILGFVLIGAILLGFFYFTKPSDEDIERQQRIQDSIRQEQVLQQQTAIQDSMENILNDSIPAVVNTDTTFNTDSAKNVQLVNNYGSFANAASGEQEFYVIKNNLMELEITTKGARAYSVNLTKYKTHDQTDLVLFDGDDNTFELQFFAEGRLINSNNLYFDPSETDTLIDATSAPKTVSFRAKISEDKYLEYVYTVQPDSYMIDFDINFINLNDIIPSSTTFLELYWNENVKHLERGEKFEKANTFLFYKLFQSSVESLSSRKDDKKEVTSKVRWIGYKQQFFSSILIAKNNFSFVDISSTETPESDTVNLRYMTSKITVPFMHSPNVNIPLAFYYGPNKYSILRKIEINGTKLGMEKVIPMGGKVFAFINKGVIIPMFNFLGKFIKNYGIIILIMTVLIKLVLFPLTYKSYSSSAKMRILKPEIEKATEKFGKNKDKAMEKQKATMDLYKKAGVNPLGGCLPMLLQFPILISLYRFFPGSIELRQQSFLWVKDLSTYDSILTWEGNIPILHFIFGNHISLFTILMSIAMIVNTTLTNTNMDSSGAQGKSMKYMMYLMPLMMIVWFNNYSAGLSYYYFLSTLIGIIQIYVIRAFTDEDKVLAQMKKNMKKNKVVKKSKFQQRLEEVQRQQNATKNKKK